MQLSFHRPERKIKVTVKRVFKKLVDSGELMQISLSSFLFSSNRPKGRPDPI